MRSTYDDGVEASGCVRRMENFLWQRQVLYWWLERSYTVTDNQHAVKPKVVTLG